MEEATLEDTNMKLTRTERLIISNQMRILAALYDDEREYLDRMRVAIDSGYALHYSQVAQHIDEDEFSEDECREVLDVLSMFRALRNGYEQIAEDDREGIRDRVVEFAGFDNKEGASLYYSRWLASTGSFDDIVPEGGLDSHSPVLDMYRRMLQEWEASEDKFSLDRQDLVRISNASIHPDNR